MRGIFLYLFPLFIALISLGQHDKCSSQMLWERNIDENASLSVKRFQLEKFTRKYQQELTTERNKKSDDIITIPVVVHVLYNQDVQNISRSQIQSQIDVLNDDFNNSNSDAVFEGDEDFLFYDEVSLGANIRFELASFDPKGNATDGITRTYTPIQGFDENLRSMYFTSTGGKDNWNPERYLNIWVIALKESSNTLGWAQFPADLINYPASDGVVIRYEVFGTTGTAGTGDWSANALGRTGTHEVGHWLNLKHTWGDLADDDSDCGSDFVDDTPPVEVANYGCPIDISNENSSCGTDSRGEMYMNYMDYVNDECMFLFSKGQVTRMRAAVEGARSGLLTSSGVTALTGIDVLEEVSVYPNPSTSDLFFINMFNDIGLIKVRDSYGRIILKKTIKATNHTIDLSSYSNGIYYLEITAKGFNTTRKLITP